MSLSASRTKLCTKWSQHSVMKSQLLLVLGCQTAMLWWWLSAMLMFSFQVVQSFKDEMSFILSMIRGDCLQSLPSHFTALHHLYIHCCFLPLRWKHWWLPCCFEMTSSYSSGFLLQLYRMYINASSLKYVKSNSKILVCCWFSRLSLFNFQLIFVFFLSCNCRNECVWRLLHSTFIIWQLWQNSIKFYIMGGAMSISCLCHTGNTDSDHTMYNTCSPPSGHEWKDFKNMFLWAQ